MNPNEAAGLLALIGTLMTNIKVLEARLKELEKENVDVAE